MKIEFKLLFIYILGSLLIFGVIFFGNLKERETLEAQFASGLQKVGETVHFSTQRLSKERGIDKIQLENFIEEATKNKSLKEISVVNSSEEVVASSNPKKIGMRHSITGSEIVVREELGKPGVNENHGHFHYDVKIPLLRNNKVIGLVQTTFYLDDFKEILHQSMVRNTLLAAVALIAGFAIVFLLLKRINKPLSRLTDAARRISDGNYSIELEGDGQDEIGTLTRTFRMMGEKISDYRLMESRMQDLERKAILSEITSSLAHEVRNPLNLINLTADHLKTKYEPREEENRKSYHEFIDSLKAQVGHLNKMIDALLSIGRPPRLQASVFLLKDLLDQIHVLVRNKLESRGILFEYFLPEKLMVFADIEQIRLVLLNMVLNAVQAIEKNGKVKVFAGKNEAENCLEIKFEDDGPGIPEEKLGRIFEPYFTSKPDGTGLGLSLSKRIISEHGGRIRVENKEKKGALFTIQLPLERLM